MEIFAGPDAVQKHYLVTWSSASNLVLEVHKRLGEENCLGTFCFSSLIEFISLRQPVIEVIRVSTDIIMKMY
jgi:hypothetical protein